MTLKEEIELLKEQVRLLKAKEKLLLAIKELEAARQPILYPFQPVYPWWIGVEPHITWEYGMGKDDHFPEYQTGDPLPETPITTCSVDSRTLANVPMTFTN